MSHLTGLSGWVHMFCLNDQIKEGDILLLRSLSLAGWCVAKATGGHYSHAALYVGNGTFIEAIPPGVEYLSICRVFVKNKKNMSVLRFFCDKKEKTDVLPKKAAQIAKTYETKPYAYYSAFMSCISGHEPSNIEGMFCSHLVSKAYSDAGHHLLDQPDYLVDPNELFKSEYLRSVTDSVVQEITLEDATHLEPLDTGHYTRPIMEFTKRIKRIVKYSSTILLSYRVGEVSDFTELIEKIAIHRNDLHFNDIDSRILEIIKTQRLGEYLANAEQVINKLDGDIYDETCRRLMSKEIDLDEVERNIIQLRLYLLNKNEILKDYEGMEEILRMFYKKTQSLSINELMCFYHKLVSIYKAHCNTYEKYIASLQKCVDIG